MKCDMCSLNGQLRYKWEVSLVTPSSGYIVDNSRVSISGAGLIAAIGAYRVPTLRPQVVHEQLVVFVHCTFLKPRPSSVFREAVPSKHDHVVLPQDGGVRSPC